MPSNKKEALFRPEFPSDENLEWIEQHHRVTQNMTLGSLSNNGSSSNMNEFGGPSGDDSDSGDRHRSQFYAADPIKRTKEYHVDQAVQAIQILKAATKPVGWKKVLKHKSGCLVYQSTDHGDRQPTFKGEHVLRGYRAQDVFSVVGVRKLWDDWYDELSCVESYDDATSLMYMVMKGTLSSKTRDISMVERIEVEKDGTIYFASCSVESNKIPRISGKVRADIFIAGWIIQPLPSNPPITKITYVIQTDLLSRLPKFIARRALAKRPLVITTIETHLKKNGVPMVISPLVSQSANRHRSLSEPLKPEKFLLHGNSQENFQNGSSFLSPIQPIRTGKEVEELEDPVDFGDDGQQHSMSTLRDRSESRNSLAPSLMSTRSIAPSLFTSEFLENNTMLGDTALFGDSLLFGKGGLFEGTARQQDEVSVTSSMDSRATSPQPPRQLLQERSRPPAPRTKSPEPDRRPKQTPQEQAQRRHVPSQPATPKSEVRSRTSQHHRQMQNPSTPESRVLPSVVTPATPPLTPTTSVDGKDTTSDSDASMTSKVKVVPRVPKTHAPVDTALPNRPSSMAFSAQGMGMRSPSAIMEARRHSTLIGRSSSFAPRHSHIIPMRSNPNLSLQGMNRMSHIGAMSSNIKRHSTAPSLDSNRSSTTLIPGMVLPHRHSETARKALAMFKVLASSSEDRWRAVSNEGGFKSYSRVISGAGLPMLRGEGTITGGWTVEQINAVIESAGCRQIWDERFENMSIAETFNHNEYLFHVTLRGVGSLTGRDLAGVTIIDRDAQTSSLFNVSTSVLDPTIPEDPGRIRALLELSGWSLRPTFDGQGNTVSVNVTFVIQIDIRGTLPTSVVKSMTSSMTMAVSRLNQFINKTGYPPFASHISGTRLLDTFEPKTGFYELCYKAAPGWTEVRVGRKVYKDGYDFFIKPDDPTVRVELAPDFGGVRVWTTLDHEGQSIVAQVSRKGQLPPGSLGQHQQQQQRGEDDSQEKEDKEEPKKRSGETRRTSRDRRSRMRDSRAGDHSIVVDAVQRSPLSLSPPPSSPAQSNDPDQASTVPSALPESERKSRSRSRAPRSLTAVTPPPGAPVPAPPRRSSSLSRYSIPIPLYLPAAEAPPLPFNISTASLNRTSSLPENSPSIGTPSPTRSSLIAASPKSTSPKTASSRATSPIDSKPASPTKPQSISPKEATLAKDDTLPSPTLGPFHIPHASSIEKLSLGSLVSKDIALDSPTDSQEAVAPKVSEIPSATEVEESISTKVEAAEELVQSSSQQQPAKGLLGTTSTLTAVAPFTSTVVAFALETEEVETIPIEKLLRKSGHDQERTLLAGASLGPAPTGSLKLAPMGSLKPAPESVTLSQTLLPTAGGLKHSSSLTFGGGLKHSSSLTSVGGPRRVTFSPDVVDKTAENSMRPRRTKDRSGKSSENKSRKAFKNKTTKEHSVRVVEANAAHMAEVEGMVAKAVVVAGEEAAVVMVAEGVEMETVKAEEPTQVSNESLESDDDDDVEFVESHEEPLVEAIELPAVVAPAAVPTVPIVTNEAPALKEKQEVGHTARIARKAMPIEYQDRESLWGMAVESFIDELTASGVKAAIVFMLLIYVYYHGL